MIRPYVLTCVLFAFAAVAAEPSRERSLEIAREALRDGIWTVARGHASEVGGEEGLLVVLESYASENKWEDVGRELAKAGTAVTNSAFGYYRAVVDGRLDDAVTALRENGTLAGLVEAKMLEAELLVRKDDVNGAKALWTEVLAMTNVPERAYALAGVNLGDVDAMRKAYDRTVSLKLKRMVGLRLGRALVAGESTRADGERLIRAIVADSADADGAREAFVELVCSEVAAGENEKAIETAKIAIETWPDTAKNAVLQECRGDALLKLGRQEDALNAYEIAETHATDDGLKSRALLRQGDILSELGKGESAMCRYRVLLEKYPETETARKLKRALDLLELEDRGRRLYNEGRTDEAKELFARVADEAPDRRAKMQLFEVLCLYRMDGREREACEKARTLSESCPDAAVRAEATLWLAKVAYNHADWAESIFRFKSYVEQCPDADMAPYALLWAARAAVEVDDSPQAIQTVTALAKRYPDSPAVPEALLVQAEQLSEAARYQEAILVLERVALSKTVTKEDSRRAQLLKADAFVKTGADDATRYQKALEIYRTVWFGEDSPTKRLQIAFQIGRTLEKMHRNDEAVDEYYTKVVLAYRDARLKGVRFDERGRETFSKAAFRLVEYFASRGRDSQAVGILDLVVESDVPAAVEARRRRDEIMNKGRFL